VRLERGVPDITCRVLSARTFENMVSWVGVKGTGRVAGRLPKHTHSRKQTRSVRSLWSIVFID
jgi:hypothetical protein